MASLIKWVPWLLTKMRGATKPNQNNFINELTYDYNHIGP